MKQTSQFRLIALLIGAVCTLSSCSKEQSVTPAPEAESTKSDVQVINGRLVFSSINTFEKVRDGLWKKNSQDLDVWENSIHFQSLRTKHIALDDTISLGLMEEFGFPMQYAALINQGGEYQIADKIYWFHNGFKYEALSENELQRIKQNPSLAVQKYVAGKSLTSVKHVALPYVGSSQNRTIRTASSSGDGKYQIEFDLNNDSGSRRRLSLELFTYAEVTYSSPITGYNRTIFTAVVLNEYCEYYSRGSRRWYRAGDERNTFYNLDITGRAQGDNFAPQDPNSIIVGPKGAPSGTGVNGSGVGQIRAEILKHGNEDFQIGVASATFYSDSDTNFNNILWDFNIKGTYTAYISSDDKHILALTDVLW